MSDGAATLPSLEISGEATAYTDTISEIVQEVLGIVRDPSLDTAFVLRLINRGIREMLAILASQNVWLPSLETTAPVVVPAFASTCPLPPNLQGNVHRVALEDGKTLQLIDRTRLRFFIDANYRSRLQYAAVYGNQLAVWGTSTEAVTLHVSYYRLPDRLTLDSRVTSLPVELSTSLLVNYCLMTCFGIIEQEQNDGKVNTKYYGAFYSEQLQNVVRVVGGFPLAEQQPFDEMGAARW